MNHPKELAAAFQPNRRAFLSAAGLTGLGALLAACSGSSGGVSGGGSTVQSGDLAKAAAEVVGNNKLGSDLLVYTWADYSNPTTFQEFTKGAGPNVRLSTFDSVEAQIAKLKLAHGSPTYDIVVPGDPYITQMVDEGLLEKLDHSKLPNFDKVSSDYRYSTFDPHGDYTVLKDYGTHGFVYDATVIKEDLTSWADFFRVAALPGVSGKVSIFDDQPSVFGLVFWRDGMDYNSGKEADLRYAKKVLVKELMPHLKAFDANAGNALINGTYVLSQMSNGQSRSVVMQDPERFKFVYPTPQSVIWSDRWAIAANAPHRDAAYAFLNYVLQPQVSANELSYSGYDTAVIGVDKFLAPSLAEKDLIIVPEDVRKRLVPQKIAGSNPSLRVTIFNEIKASASG